MAPKIIYFLSTKTMKRGILVH